MPRLITAISITTITAAPLITTTNKCNTQRFQLQLASAGQQDKYLATSFPPLSFPLSKYSPHNSSSPQPFFYPPSLFPLPGFFSI
ncbi:hypothetical protein E2C01_080282 [Portunus trituberculatus]|uniref:Uncharacterized protein n=1 Tax=Portunus trituberculatus TaxID=210409 RepID=A0A5B7IT10_PORTR|nr:hypothetical protein [Portunus trituberculatus]